MLRTVKMKGLRWTGAAFVALGLAVCARGAELESGVPVGGKIGTYSTTKCGGADDGVRVGISLCYT